MGNNEPLPPPPPGNNPPQFPPQGYPPQQPYQQPTQPQPQYQQPYPGQQYPPQPQQYAPQYGQYPQAPAPAPKKNTGLIIGIGVVVIAAIVAGVLIFAGGDDKKKATTATTAATVAPVTTGGSDTIVLTVPVTTPPVNTDAPDTTLGGNADGFPVTDDTGMMTVFLPNGADYQTTPITKDDIVLPRVVAAADVQAFMNDDVTQGIIFMGIPSTYNATADDAISILGPPDGTCAVQTSGAPIQTPFGAATVVLYDGCGPGGGYSKVVMGVATSGTFVAMGVYLQGTGPATDMLDTAESVWTLITVN